jgi:hypothetical protein
MGDVTSHAGDAMSAPVIDSRNSFHEAVVWGFHEAIAQGARRIVCTDENFAEWPWDDVAILDALSVWLRLPQRRLELLARSYETVPRTSPRFNAWRRNWTHAMATFQLPDDWTATLPSVLVSDGAVSVHLVDAVHWRGRALCDARVARQWRESSDVVLQRSETAFAVRTLGL